MWGSACGLRAPSNVRRGFDVLGGEEVERVRDSVDSPDHGGSTPARVLVVRSRVDPCPTPNRRLMVGDHRQSGSRDPDEDTCSAESFPLDPPADFGEQMSASSATPPQTAVFVLFTHSGHCHCRTGRGAPCNLFVVDRRAGILRRVARPTPTDKTTA